MNDRPWGRYLRSCPAASRRPGRLRGFGDIVMVLRAADPGLLLACIERPRACRRAERAGLVIRENYMAENMIVPVTGGCPKCGEPNIPVPVDYNDDTIITCPKCRYEAPWAKFFSLTSTD
jgi:hypothetical protein